MRVCLLPLNGGEPIELTRPITLVGRRRVCDICLDHPSVSKVHLVLVQTDGAVLFRDLGSTNGTKVNGKRVRRGALLPGDTISVASERFKVEFLPDAERGELAGTEVITEEPERESAVVRRVFRADELKEGGPAASDEFPEADVRPVQDPADKQIEPRPADARQDAELELELPDADEHSSDSDSSTQRQERRKASDEDKGEAEPYRSSLLFPELDE